MKLSEIVIEGTWAQPNSIQKVKQVLAAFSEPLLPEDAEELYHSLG